MIGADGRNNHRLTRDSPTPSGFPALAWAPDGRSIAYETDRHRQRRHLPDRRQRPQQGSTHELSRERHRPLLATSIARSPLSQSAGVRSDSRPRAAFVNAVRVSEEAALAASSSSRATADKPPSDLLHRDLEASDDAGVTSSRE